MNLRGRTRLASMVVVAASALAVGVPSQSTAQQGSPKPRTGVPTFEVDTSWQWPPSLPNNWVVGVVTGVFVDRRDHVWVMHRSRQVPVEQTDRAAPPVLEFDANRKFVQAWGGPGEGYDWPDMEHGLSVDHQDNVWITGLNPLERSYSAPTQRTDDMIVKFTSKGKFIRQFGGRDRHALKTGGNADTASVHLACEAVVYPKTNELFVADGYANPAGHRPRRRHARVQADVGRLRQTAAANAGTERRARQDDGPEGSGRVRLGPRAESLE